MVSGNINEDCLENNNGSVENQACWNSSAGTNSENSEWIYYEDPDNGNYQFQMLILFQMPVITIAQHVIII